MLATAKGIEQALRAHASADDAVFLQRFFKTGEGQYGAGDVFIGVRVPVTRAICQKNNSVSLAEVKKLLVSPIHECRLAAVILLANQYKKRTNRTVKKYTDYIWKQLMLDTLIAGILLIYRLNLLLGNTYGHVRVIIFLSWQTATTYGIDGWQCWQPFVS